MLNYPEPGEHLLTVTSQVSWGILMCDLWQRRVFYPIHISFSPISSPHPEYLSSCFGSMRGRKELVPVSYLSFSKPSLSYVQGMVFYSWELSLREGHLRVVLGLVLIIA